MILVLTYDAPHRKTQDLLLRLKSAGHRVDVLAVPWETRKNFKPLVSHRPGEPNWPAQALPMSPGEMCRNLGYSYEVMDRDHLTNEVIRYMPALTLIGGAGILDKRLIDSVDIVNAHPAWIPYGRGLDSLKWCIYRDLPVGVTTHIIDEHTDAGWIIEQRYVPIYEGDTFHAFAHRQYEIELEMLVAAVTIMKGQTRADLQRVSFHTDDDMAYPVTRRMPHVKEVVMLRRFAHRRDHQEEK